MVRGTTRPDAPEEEKPEIPYAPGLVKAMTNTNDSADAFLAKIPKKLGNEPSFMLFGEPGNGEDGLAHAIAKQFSRVSPDIIYSSQLGKSGIITALLDECYSKKNVLIIDDRVAGNLSSNTGSSIIYNELHSNIRRHDVPIILMTDNHTASRYAGIFPYTVRVEAPDEATAQKVLGLAKPVKLPTGTSLLDCFRLAKQLVAERPKQTAEGALSGVSIGERLTALVKMRFQSGNKIGFAPNPD